MTNHRGNVSGNRPNFLGRNDNPNDLLNKIQDIYNRLRNLERSGVDSASQSVKTKLQRWGFRLLGSEQDNLDTGETFTDHLTTVVSTTSLPVLVLANIQYEGTKSGDGPASSYMRIQRRTASSSEDIADVYVEHRYTNGNAIAESLSLSVVDTPGNGTFTYALQKLTTGYTTNPPSATSGQIHVMSFVDIPVIQS